MAQLGTIIDGKYEILREVGKGGMSVVYLAMDTRLNKQWAVKEIKKKSDIQSDEIIVNSLLVEANLMKKLDHPSLPRIVDIIESELTIFIVMDYIEGESLDKIIKEYGPQSEQMVIDWAKQICDVLYYLHSQKPSIIYRDMKPANIMLKPEGNIKIIDFGIAREYKELNYADTTVLGTKGYAPPEQYNGQTDPRSDIYSLGMTMHHLLTGNDPRKGKVYAPVRMWNPELSEGIEKIIDKCVQPAAENRYQNCKELQYDLEHPELITKDYRKKQKRKIFLFFFTLCISIVMCLTGVICGIISDRINENNYDNLVSISKASSREEKIENYKKAIEIYDDRVEAYVCILEAYEDDGNFGKKENDEFLAIYNANKNKLVGTEPDVAELNYKIGMMYFNYYIEDDGSYVFSSRVQKAYSFFEENYIVAKNIEYKNKKISDCYYHICSFYKKYILGTLTVEEASKEDYEKLFKIIDETTGSMKDAGAYDKISLYNSIFMLLYDQRSGMVQVNMDKEKVLDIMDMIYINANNLTVQKRQSMKLQEEIVENYSDYRDAIERAYKNAEVRE